jgi:hypothetical protein
MTVVLGASLLGTLLVWWRLFGWKELPALKAIMALLAIFPVVGPVMCLWIIGMPDKMPTWLQVPRGRGGFIHVPERMRADMEQLQKELDGPQSDKHGRT